MEKRGLAAALAMLTMATTGTAFAATNFWQPVYYTNVGYNASTVNKVANADHAYIGVTGSNHNELSTNYLVTRADNGVQMTQELLLFQMEIEVENQIHISQDIISIQVIAYYELMQHNQKLIIQFGENGIRTAKK